MTAKRFAKMIQACLCLAVLTALFTTLPDVKPALAYDCAHGPDTYRVRNVDEWDTLNIRAGASASTEVVGQIPPNGTDVYCLGPCKGNWCQIAWRGTVGWTNMKYLGE